MPTVCLCEKERDEKVEEVMAKWFGWRRYSRRIRPNWRRKKAKVVCGLLLGKQNK